MGGIVGTVPSSNGFGVATGTANPVALPDINIQRLLIKVSPLGVIGWIGSYGNATFPIAAGSQTDWIEADNLSDFFYRGTGAYFHYWYQN